MTNEHRVYDAITNATLFSATGAGPMIRPVTLSAALTPSLVYPCARITLMSCVGSIGLTVHQAAQLRDQLDRAIADAFAASPQLAARNDVERLPREVARG